MIFYDWNAVVSFFNIEEELKRRQYLINNKWSKTKIELGILMQRLINVRILVRNSRRNQTKIQHKIKIRVFFENRYHIKLGKETQPQHIEKYLSKYPLDWIQKYLTK